MRRSIPQNVRAMTLVRDLLLVVMLYLGSLVFSSAYGAHAAIPDDVELLGASSDGVTLGLVGDTRYNRCDQHQITVALSNASGSPMCDLIITVVVPDPDYGYVVGSSVGAIDGSPLTMTDPDIAGQTLTWSLDSACSGGPCELDDGSSVEVMFGLATGCSAVSGTLVATASYSVSGAPSTVGPEAQTITVMHGALALRKDPLMVSGALGHDVNWQLVVENKGDGVVKNIVITEKLGDGLSFVSATPAGSNIGQTITWSESEIGALAEVDPGAQVVVDISATLVDCENLASIADARWGCDDGPICWDTSSDGGSAECSAYCDLSFPLLKLAPPDIAMDYCGDAEPVAFAIDNVGDGMASDVQLFVDMTGLSVSDVSDGASWVAAGGAASHFALDDSIAPGGQANLTFNLAVADGCEQPTESTLIWQPTYSNATDDLFYPPLCLSDVSISDGETTLDVVLMGPAEPVQVGDTITNGVRCEYQGPISCGAGSAGMATVSYTAPDNAAVLDHAGGVYAPGGDGNGGTVTWQVDPSAGLDVAVTLEALSDCPCGADVDCQGELTASVTATMVDCCGCALEDSDSITCALGYTGALDGADKTQVLGPSEPCGEVWYSTVMTFSADMPAVLADLTLTDTLDLGQTVVPASATAGFDGEAMTLTVSANPGPDTCAFTFADVAPRDLAGRRLEVRYATQLSADSLPSCGGDGFVSWSVISISGTDAGGDAYDPAWIAAPVEVEAPMLSLEIDGLGDRIEACEQRTITLTLTQTSATADPSDARLVLSGMNYFVVDPAASVCGGDVSPVSCTPDITDGDYVWEYGDAFGAAGQTATLQLGVQARSTGTGTLVATATFDDACHDDLLYDDTCSVEAVAAPIRPGGDLLITQQPETVYAGEETVSWVIDVVNRGTGTARNVWIDDVLGAGLVYEHGVNPVVVNSMTGVAITPYMDHAGSAINGLGVTIDAMLPGEHRQIDLMARMVDCGGLQNDVSASWGCIGVDGQTDVSARSSVEIPPPAIVVRTSVPGAELDACSTPTANVSIRSAGQTSIYDIELEETLPDGLEYVPSSTQWRINGGAWSVQHQSADPDINLNRLTWDASAIAGLASLAPDDELEIEFDLRVHCLFGGGQMAASATYGNPCGQVFAESAWFDVVVRQPVIVVTKTRADEPIDCGNLVEWTIEIENNSGYDLPLLYVQDHLGSAFGYDSHSWEGAYAGIAMSTTGQTHAWELTNLGHGDTATLSLAATVQYLPPASCSVGLTNTVEVLWGCGSPDGDPATVPGQPGNDSGCCLCSEPVSVTRTETREPQVDIVSVTFAPVPISACNDSMTMDVVIENSGPVDAYDIDLVISLPSGLHYSAGSSRLTQYGSSVPSLIGDPSVTAGLTGDRLTFYDSGDKANDLSNTLQAAGGNDRLVLQVTLASDVFAGGDVSLDLFAYDCCGGTQHGYESSVTVPVAKPSLAISQTPLESQVGVGGVQRWDITVSNVGDLDAERLQIVDVLGDWINYVDASPAPLRVDGQQVTWELDALGVGLSTTVSITGTLVPDHSTGGGCSPAYRQNNAKARWGCISDDWASVWVYATPATFLMPDLTITNLVVAPTGGSDGALTYAMTATVANEGDRSSAQAFAVSVSDGAWTSKNRHDVTIAAGAMVDVALETGGWHPACADCLEQSLSLDVDADDDIAECDESNNTFIGQYTPMAPDLLAASLELGLTPTSDGQFDVRGTVEISNTGCGPFSGDLPLRITLYDDTGGSGKVISQWTTTLSQVQFEPSASAQTFTLPTRQLTGDLVASSTGCEVSALVLVDPNDSVAECSGLDNSAVDQAISVDLPDLVVGKQTLSVTCASGGRATISGMVTLANDGCGSDLRSSLPMRYTLFDNTGCAGNQIDQWTETLGSVDLAAGGGTQAFPMSHTTGADLVTHSSGCQVSLLVEADYCDAIVESNGTNNTLCADNLSVDIPDVRVTEEALSVSCASEGKLAITGTVTVANDGCGSSLNHSLPISFALFSGDQCAGTPLKEWTETFTSVSIAAGGGTQTFTLTPADLTVDPQTHPADGQYALQITADADHVVCESDGENNSLCTNKRAALVDLVAAGVSSDVQCAGDGRLQGKVVTVRNAGSADATGVVVRLSSDCGLTFADQTTDAKAGATVPVTFAFTSGLTSCSCAFTMAVDPDNAICETHGYNSTATSGSSTMAIPDVTVSDHAMTMVASGDGQLVVSGTVSLANDGCGGALDDEVPMRFALYDSASCGGEIIAQWTQPFTPTQIASGGGTQAFAVKPHLVTGDLRELAPGCVVSLLIEADYADVVCEWDGTNNALCVDDMVPDVPDLALTDVDLSVEAVADGQSQVTGTLSLQDLGCGGGYTGPLVARFSVYGAADGQGVLLDQWDETIKWGVSLSSVSRTVAITPRMLTGDLCSAVGDCTLSVRVQLDPDQAVSECSGDNNSAMVNAGLLTPDLVVVDTAVEIDPSGNGHVTVKVSNGGCAAAMGVPLTVESDCGGTVGKDTVTLAVGGSKTLSFPFVPTCTSCTCTYTATLDADLRINECRGDNNAASAAITIAPEIELTDDGPLASGSEHDWGIQLVGRPDDVVFTLRNVGIGDLHIQTPLTQSGDSRFSITSEPQAVVAPSEATAFTVRYLPQEEGDHVATVSIVSNDDDENPYLLDLRGVGARPKLSMEKTCDAQQARPGQMLAYSIVVANSGIIAAHDVTLSDTLPGGLTFVGPVTLLGNSGTVAQSGVDLPILARGVSVGVGEKVTVTYKAIVTAGVIDGELLPNLVVATGAGVATPVLGETTIVVGSAAHEAELVVTPATVCPGWLQHYRFQLANTGDIAITNLVITAPVPVWASGAWVSESSPLPGRLDDEMDQLLFKASEVAPGEAITASGVFRAYTTARGDLLSVWYYGADQLAGTKVLSGTVALDDSLCATPTPTVIPTPTLTPEPSLTPEQRGPYLPLVVRAH